MGTVEPAVLIEESLSSVAGNRDGYVRVAGPAYRGAIIIIAALALKNEIACRDSRKKTWRRSPEILMTGTAFNQFMLLSMLY
jgi:hypothetical protein